MKSAQTEPSMPRVVLDSSVLVSAFLTPHGSVVRLLRDPVRSRYQLCLSEPILTETAEALLFRPRLLKFAAYADTDVHDYIRWLLGQTEIVPNVPEPHVDAAAPTGGPRLA